MDPGRQPDYSDTQYKAWTGPVHRGAVSVGPGRRADLIRRRQDRSMGQGRLVHLRLPDLLVRLDFRDRLDRPARQNHRVRRSHFRHGQRFAWRFPAEYLRL